jgi:peptidoglycan hydrolase-like protein with peptidoglycan-binding domain
MKKIISTILSLLFVSSIAIAVQTPNGQSTDNSASASKATKKRGPIFRANKDQVKQAQKILKDHGFYIGDETGKLDPDTRGSLKKYQTAESLKVTGTLNKVTLEKMGIILTDKQKVM